ncbi:MAG: DNA polymerase III subunit delta [Bacteroidetes bacterium]|nr:DNA polymerase III subunit delta [Bacteroidota bacterium]MBP7399792.1 DNA polymerase III subunit delta [Chitinophagales bacterium]MBK7110105.1 DNA polymerase III subunit delta [Bacteroidota bacterium]MBK8487169.1 DNA polymerase III subunit delta [Bacteroidota bacterium]MBK8680555.1 DNA polymerase III subunit delta [Bacteroidota bacterium]
MQQDDLLNNIKNKKLSAIYLLHGDESYHIDTITDALENTLLTEDEKSFNLTIFYGKDAQIRDITDTCRRFPMFSNLQVVILKEAQHLKGIEELEPYAAKPVPTTIFIICYKGGKLDARKKLFKSIQHNGTIFLSESPKEDQIPKFIKNYLQEKNRTIDAKAADILTEYLGNNLSKISNELDKLCINSKPEKAITISDIEHNIGISKEYNVYELQSALLQKDLSKAYHIIFYMNKNLKNNPFVLTLSNLHNAFIKLYQYMRTPNIKEGDLYRTYGIHFSQLRDYKRAKDIYTLEQVEHVFELLMEYDLRSKGLQNNSTEAAELGVELIFRILHFQNELSNNISQNSLS